MLPPLNLEPYKKTFFSTKYETLTCCLLTKRKDKKKKIEFFSYRLCVLDTAKHKM